jgi:hypothetical protein
MNPHKGQGNQSSASKVLADEAIDGFSILESSQQSEKAVGLVIQRKHRLVNNCKSRMTCLSKCSSLGNSILEHG